MEVTSRYSVSKGLIPLSIVHVIIMVVVYLSTSFLSSSNWYTFLSLAVGLSVPLYLTTGVPGIFARECDECGNTTGAGELRCDSCGASHGVEAVGAQIIWFSTGYSVLFVLLFLSSLLFLNDVTFRPERPIGFGLDDVYIIGGIIDSISGGYIYTVIIMAYFVVTGIWVSILVLSYVFSLGYLIREGGDNRESA